MKESFVVNACIRWLHLHNVKHWRNNTGAVKTESGAWIRFGDKGSPDIMCRVPVTAGNQRIASLVGIECKSDTGKLNPDQQAWKAAHEKDGGIYILARSIDDIEQHKHKLIERN